MVDVTQFYGNDLAVSATGDLLTSDGLSESQQRVWRRLLTNPTKFNGNGNVTIPGDYLWQPEYGAGVPARVGTTLNIPSLTALIKTQMYLEPTVVQNPEPVITLTQIANGVFAQIQYTESDTGQTSVLSFTATQGGAD